MHETQQSQSAVGSNLRSSAPLTSAPSAGAPTATGAATTGLEVQRQRLAESHLFEDESHAHGPLQQARAPHGPAAAMPGMPFLEVAGPQSPFYRFSSTMTAVLPQGWAGEGSLPVSGLPSATAVGLASGLCANSTNDSHGHGRLMGGSNTGWPRRGSHAPAAEAHTMPPGLQHHRTSSMPVAAMQGLHGGHEALPGASSPGHLAQQALQVLLVEVRGELMDVEDRQRSLTARCDGVKGALIEHLRGDDGVPQGTYLQSLAWAELLAKLQAVLQPPPALVAPPSPPGQSQGQRVLHGMAQRVAEEAQVTQVELSAISTRLQVLRFARSKWESTLRLLDVVCGDAALEPLVGQLHIIMFKEATARIQAFQQQQQAVQQQPDQEQQCRSSGTARTSSTGGLMPLTDQARQPKAGVQQRQDAVQLHRRPSDSAGSAEGRGPSNAQLDSAHSLPTTAATSARHSSKMGRGGSRHSWREEQAAAGTSHKPGTATPSTTSTEGLRRPPVAVQVQHPAAPVMAAPSSRAVHEEEGEEVTADELVSVGLRTIGMRQRGVRKTRPSGVSARRARSVETAGGAMATAGEQVL